MTCTYIEHPDAKMIEIIVDGKVTEADFDQLSSQIKSFIGTHGKIKILEIVRDFGGFDWAALTKGIKFDMEHLKDFTHCAVVTDEGWIGPMTRMLSPFFSIQIRTFSMDQEGDARLWLEGA